MIHKPLMAGRSPARFPIKPAESVEKMPGKQKHFET
jgi:hypothetical protein